MSPADILLAASVLADEAAGAAQREGNEEMARRARIVRNVAALLATLGGGAPTPGLLSIRVANSADGVLVRHRLNLHVNTIDVIAR